MPLCMDTHEEDVKVGQREPRESKHDCIVESLQEQCHLAEETMFRLEQVKDVGKGVDLQTKARVCQHDTGAWHQN
jgi:hypothetical protein